jgi:hypothetical protein
MVITMFKISIMILSILLFLILAVVVYAISNKKNPSYRKKIRIQMFLYLIELVIITSFLSYLLTSIEEKSLSIYEWNSKKNDFQILERYIFSLTAYQGIKYLFIKMRDGADYDSFISLKYYLDSITIMFESEVEVTDDFLDNYYRRITNPMAMFNDKTREIGLEAFEYLKNYKSGKVEVHEMIYVLKKLARDLEHEANITNLFWMNSLFLRITK